MGERAVPESSGDNGANGIERCAESFIVCVSAGFYVAEEVGPVEEVESVGAEIGVMFEMTMVWCGHVHWVHEDTVKGHEGHGGIHRNLICGFLSGPTFRRRTTVIRFLSRFWFPLCRWLYTLRTPSLRGQNSANGLWYATTYESNFPRAGAEACRTYMLLRNRSMAGRMSILRLVYTSLGMTSIVLLRATRRISYFVTKLMTPVACSLSEKRITIRNDVKRTTCRDLPRLAFVSRRTRPSLISQARDRSSRRRMGLLRCLSWCLETACARCHLPAG